MTKRVLPAPVAETAPLKDGPRKDVFIKGRSEKARFVLARKPKEKK